ncbi:Xanthine dehydrogenase, molybdenum binding subunit [Clostridiaceae bacterium JG1575]|nr:Xanthine dehydrogenase, molybdenum binding subunit [Clostridiaceae bacterium JG1575]
MNTNSVGYSEHRVDAFAKVTGQARYPADLYKEGMLYGALLRSDRACARFTLDDTQAQKSPGVRLILTAKDVPGLNHHGVLFKDHDVFCVDRVRRVGDPLAFVVADTREQAQAAVKKIQVTYEDTPGVYGAKEAMASDAPAIHEDKENLLYTYRLKKGDARSALDSSAHVVKTTYVLPSVDHMFLQPEAGLAWMEGELLHVAVATQYPHFDVSEIAEALDLPKERIIYENPAIGGAFGGREDLSLQIPLALAALRLHRPVKSILDREESFYAHSKRHAITMEYETGCDETGHLTALYARFYGDTGAYASWAINVMRKCGVHSTGPYEIPHVDVESYAVYTNNPFAGAMRGFGATQPPVGYEQQMDQLAQKVGISPTTIRKHNLFRKGSHTATGQNLLEAVPLERALDAVTAYFDAHPMTPSDDPSVKKGRGIALAFYGTGYGNGFPDVSTAQVEWSKTGRFTLFVSAAECGQGSDTALRQILAEGLHCPLSSIDAVTSNTSVTTDSGTAAASRQTYNTGNAIRRAAHKMHSKLHQAAQKALELNSDIALVFDASGVHLSYDESKALSWQALAKAYYSEAPEEGLLRTKATFTAQTTSMDPATGQGNPYWPYTFGACGVEVSVDTSTGRVRVLDAISAQDVGRAINPALVEGQMDGGFAMGMGYALMEDLGLVQGRIKNNSFTGYIIPTAMDMPPLKKVILEDPEVTGPYGAKGIGEPVMTYVAPAILNAINDAVGIVIQKLPAAPHEVLAALQRKKEAAKRRTP